MKLVHYALAVHTVVLIIALHTLDDAYICMWSERGETYT